MPARDVSARPRRGDRLNKHAGTFQPGKEGRQRFLAAAFGDKHDRAAVQVIGQCEKPMQLADMHFINRQLLQVLKLRAAQPLPSPLINLRNGVLRQITCLNNVLNRHPRQPAADMRLKVLRVAFLSASGLWLMRVFAPQFRQRTRGDCITTSTGFPANGVSFQLRSLRS